MRTVIATVALALAAFVLGVLMAAPAHTDCPAAATALVLTKA